MLKRNIIANLFGRSWTLLLAVAVTPLYLYLLGIEAFGLIGLLTALQGVGGILDLGLGLTLNRELARLSGGPDAATRQRDTLRTLEIVSWSVSIVGGIAIFFFADAIAAWLINPEKLSQQETTNAIRWMGAILALQLPFSFYQGGLMGLQSQVRANTVQAITQTLRYAGGVAVLMLGSQTVFALLAWHCASIAIGVVIMRAQLGGQLPPGRTAPAWRPQILKQNFRFALTVASNSVVGILHTQLDKFVVLKLLGLQQFAYYTIAVTGASVLWALIVPVGAALFPRYAELLAQKDEIALGRLYHQACQLMALLILPPLAALALFSEPLLLAWTHNPEVAKGASVAIILIATGTALNGLSIASTQLQSAAGWPQLVLLINIFAALALVPAMMFAVGQFGLTGAASVWVMLNSLYLWIGIPVMHRRLLRGHARLWLVHDLAIPAAAITLFTVAAYVVVPLPVGVSQTLIAGFAVWSAASIVGLLAAPLIRRVALSQLGF